MSGPQLNSSEEGQKILFNRSIARGSVISTSSNYAFYMQKIAKPGDKNPEHVRTIGLGSCGSVFELPGTEIAFKKGSGEQAVWKDFCYTNKVFNASKKLRQSLQQTFPQATIPRTPRCYEYHPMDDDAFWDNNLRRFPKEHRNKKPLFSVDRILPLPRPTRESLIATYFDESQEAQEKAKVDPENQDCLVRVYIGENETQEQETGAYDSLRNFPMRMNMLLDAELDVLELAMEMAIGLAIVHWGAQLDGMDMEFVLGSSATVEIEDDDAYEDATQPPHKVDNVVNFTRRETHLWVLDFDKASETKLTEQDVETKLAPAFLGNDPYYPRPQVDEDA